MTSEQHAQRIRQIAFMLEKADYGMGMPRDYQRVLELRVALNEAIKDYANALDIDPDRIDSDYIEQMGGY